MCGNQLLDHCNFFANSNTGADNMHKSLVILQIKVCHLCEQKHKAIYFAAVSKKFLTDCCYKMTVSVSHSLHSHCTCHCIQNREVTSYKLLECWCLWRLLWQTLRTGLPVTLLVFWVEYHSLHLHTIKTMNCDIHYSTIWTHMWVWYSTIYRKQIWK